MRRLISVVAAVTILATGCHHGDKEASKKRVAKPEKKEPTQLERCQKICDKVHRCGKQIFAKVWMHGSDPRVVDYIWEKARDKVRPIGYCISTCMKNPNHPIYVSISSEAGGGCDWVAWDLEKTMKNSKEFGLLRVPAYNDIALEQMWNRRYDMVQNKKFPLVSTRFTITSFRFVGDRVRLIYRGEVDRIEADAEIYHGINRGDIATGKTAVVVFRVNSRNPRWSHTGYFEDSDGRVTKIKTHVKLKGLLVYVGDYY